MRFSSGLIYLKKGSRNDRARVFSGQPAVRVVQREREPSRPVGADLPAEAGDPREAAPGTDAAAIRDRRHRDEMQRLAELRDEATAGLNATGVDVTPKPDAVGDRV